MTVSVVIPEYNGQNFVENNLPGIINLHPEQIIVVDDVSTDGSADYLSSRFPQVTLIRHARNQRFPKTVNDGFKACQTDLVLLLNQDVQVDPQVIDKSLSHFTDPKTFAVTLCEQKNSYPEVRLKNGFIEYQNGPKIGKPHLSFWANGGSAVFRKSYWDILGGFDESFTPGYFEDMDLGFRAWKRGWQIIWEPGAKVTHQTGSTHDRVFTPDYLRRIKFRNYLMVHWKNLELPNLIIHKLNLIKRIFLHPGLLVPVFLAFKHLPTVLRYRWQAKKQHLLSDSQIFNNV